MENINFGIDLGTTNSGIGKFYQGKVNIFKNPVGFRDTLPSVVAYRNSRILVGDKARELISVQPENVFSSFKRKMGSEHIYAVPAINENKTAINFSELVLRELINFVGDDKPTAAVITIPASFDTIQSNATKTAGYNAGLQEIVLLQEPIAACLAYANLQNIPINEDKTWLVYDFGGGTFDVALVNINNRELKVMDHEGNNFLGGLDIDNLMVEHILCPVLESELGISDLWKQIVGTEDSPYKKLFFELLYRAEEAKKELSIKESAFVELDIDSKFIELEITRQRFNELIHPKVIETITLTNRLLQKNSISKHQIERIILVGGTTYIPYVKTTLQKEFATIVDSSIDPTTAIIVGASYYAGTKTRQLSTSITDEKEVQTMLNDVKLAYEVNSQDDDELLVALVPNEFSGYYRITRSDGGFDTGLITFHSRFTEFLKLIPKNSNFFNVKIFDKYQNLVYEKENLVINHGIYNITGQPLPNDICLEIDDSLGTTYLEKIFRKNDILPLSKKLYKTISKPILKDSGEKLIINIVEGRAETSPASNLCIGYLEIKSEMLSANLLKGTDIEIDFEISESRDLTVNVFIGAIDLEITEVFNASAKQVSPSKIQHELENSLINVDEELLSSHHQEYSPTIDQLNDVRLEIIDLLRELIEIEGDLVTDRIYNIDERKRKVFQIYDDLVRRKHLLAEIDNYQTSKMEVKESLLLKPNPRIEGLFNKVIKNEAQFLNSNQLSLIKSKTKELDKISNEIYYQEDESYINLFYFYAYRELNEYADEKLARNFINGGEKAIAEANYKELRGIINGLYSLLKEKPKNYFDDKDGTLGLK
ncbi:Hsp70 family protein [Pedobacter endophyticus]|uniref:Hsp70 family protein n=1 Tax=Pedobacter endophyticus TaxID=2789740 RepID=A0A7U3Q5F7_9SPHI|nr:Hsp70 family protein [Pedobacter endophyticus]QPH38077.1 Hsp70 family protein [Pedobacter endophyticus]